MSIRCKRRQALSFKKGVEFILDRLKKIEQLLNRILERFYRALGFFVQKKTPKKVKQIAQKTKTEVQSSKNKTISFWCQFKQNIFYPIVMFFKNFGFHVAKAQKKANSAIQNFFLNLKKKRSKSFKERLTLILSTLFLPLFIKSKEWLSSIKPLTMALTISLSTLIGLTILSVYTAQEKLQEEQKRTVASKAKPGSFNNQTDSFSQGRPEYYKRNERFIKILNIELPLYVQNVQSISSVNLDFVMIPSNRYIREYLYENEYLVQDRLNVMVEPIIPDMTLGDEGRQIIREKIRNEMNNLLDDLQIKGEIEDVYIDSILGV